MSSPTVISNRDLFLPYAGPYLAYVAIATFTQGRVEPIISYGVRVLVVLPFLVWAWRWYIPVRGIVGLRHEIAWGGVVGLVGAFAWILLVTPFARNDAPEWNGLDFFIRAIVMVTLVPVFEEIFMRVYIFRVALLWSMARKQGERYPLSKALDESSIAEVSPRNWSTWAVFWSTIAFASGHRLEEWGAAIVYGLLMCFLVIRSGGVFACMVAHGITNAIFAVYVYVFGKWGIW